MTNFRLTLEYDGAGFRGWQVQSAGERTVQAELEAAIERVSGLVVRVHGAGRTDAGVHAQGQVASVALDTRLDAAALQRALNGCLPPDVAIVASAIESSDFHARFSAIEKLYAYRVWNNPVRSPLHAARSHPVVQALDRPAMQAAAKALLGRHDFASFQAAGSDVATTVRTLSRFEIDGSPGAEFTFWVAGDGFLRHMVRTLVGTLIDVGRGRRPASSMAAILAARDRSAAGPTAPAQGLTLVRVEY